MLPVLLFFVFFLVAVLFPLAVLLPISTPTSSARIHTRTLKILGIILPPQVLRQVIFVVFYHERGIIRL